MEINPKLLTASGKTKLKNLSPEFGALDYGCLSRLDFKKIEDYYDHLKNWDTHRVLREIFNGSGVEGGDECGGCWDGLSCSERAIYRNIANIIIELRQKVDDAANDADEVARRLDRI
jgi:hypothetical protein